MTSHPTSRALMILLTGLAPLLCRAGAADEASAAPAAEPAGFPASLLGGKTDLVAGAGLAYGARYPGAGTGRLQALPVLSVQRGVLFADTTRGAGLQYQAASGFYVSQSLFYDAGRLDRNSGWRPGSGRLAGMGEVPGSATARTLLAQQLTPRLLASAEAEFTLRDSARRNRYRAGLEFSALKTDADSVTLNADAWWGDRRHNQAYFGVTPAQAARTAFSSFQAGAGLYAASAGVAWEHRFGSHWASTLQLSATHYTGKAGDSPLAARRTAPSAMAAVTYSY